MFSLIYRSRARESFDLPQVYKMLSEARNFNAMHGITGCLLYHKGRFVQLLEGEEEEVRSLYERIERDERHHQVELLEQEQISQRLFSEWSMAFQDMGDASQHARYKQILMHSFFAKSRIYQLPSKSGLTFFSEVQSLLSEL